MEKEKFIIDKDMLIGDILSNAPEKAEILMEAGMHCISCPASLMETLEQACMVHGLDVEDVLEELNKQDENEK